MNEVGLAHVSDPASWDEICRRFPDQWIVLVELDWTDDRGDEIRTAFVAGHGTKREALASARPLLAVFDKLGCFHTGASRVPALPPILYTTATTTAVAAPASVAAPDFAFA